MNEPDYAPYSSLAIFALALGVLAAPGLLVPSIAVLAVPGLVMGCLALRTIRRYELRGARVAIAGITLSLAFGTAAPLCQWARVRAERALFDSESEAGYERLNFARLARDPGFDLFAAMTQSSYSGKSQSLEDFVGRRICLKGYPAFDVYHGPSLVDRFTFSPDGRSGGVHRTVAVQLETASEMQSLFVHPLAVSGILVRNPQAEADQTAPRFLLKFPGVRRSRTPRGLADYYHRC